MCQRCQKQCHQEARFHYGSGLLAGSPKVECSQLRHKTEMHPPSSGVMAASAEDNAYGNREASGGQVLFILHGKKEQ